MDNIHLPIEGDFVNSQSRYRLAILAAQRTRQLMEGEKSKLQTRHVKPTSIALEEILKGDLEILYGKEAVRYQDEAVRIRKEKSSRYLSPEREEELRKEIKKDLSVFLSDTTEQGPALREDAKTEETSE